MFSFSCDNVGTQIANLLAARLRVKFNGLVLEVSVTIDMYFGDVHICVLINIYSKSFMKGN